MKLLGSWLFFLLLSIFCMSESGHGQQDSLSIREYYQDVFDSREFKFAGNIIYELGTNGVPTKDQPSSAYISGLTTAISKLPSVYGLSCLIKAQQPACIVAYGESRIALKMLWLTKNDGQWVTKEIEGQFNFQLPFVRELSSSGWLVADAKTASVSFVPFDYSQRNERLVVDYDESQFAVALQKVSSEKIIIQKLDKKNYLADDRSEIEWLLVNASRPEQPSARIPPKHCKLFGLIENDYLCVSNSILSSHALNRLTYDKAGQYSSDIALNLSNMGPTGATFSNGRSIIVNGHKQGIKTVYEITKDTSDSPELLSFECRYGLGNNLNLAITNMASDNQSFILRASDPLTPVTFYLVTRPEKEGDACAYNERKILGQGPQAFNANNIEIVRKSTSTRKVPFTFIRNKNASGPYEGVTIIEVYGAYNLPLVEGYLGAGGGEFIKGGGTWVSAHVRGSAGFGVQWREEGRGVGKKEALIDFMDVAKQLIRDNISREGKIITWGVSAGGIPAAASVLKKPALFAGSILTSPCLLLTEQRPGVCNPSDEFGNPEIPSELAIMHQISPAHIYATKRETPPLLIFQHKGDRQVPIKVTEIFQSVGPDTAPIEVITFNSAGHGGATTIPDAIAYSVKWLDFVRRITQ